MKWRWIDTHVVLAIHNQQLAEHGGAPGVRDIGLLESALARPQHLGSYGDRSDVAALAAAYGYGLIRNHPFVDANKRTSLVVVELFLVLNGCRLLAENAECVAAMLSLAEGTISEAEFAAWIQARVGRYEQSAP